MSPDGKCRIKVDDLINKYYDELSLKVRQKYGMTKDEISRADRGSAIELLRRIVLPSGQVSSWTLSGNVLTVNIYCDDLRVVNRTVQNIAADDHVNFCTVNTAATTDRNNYGYTDGGVTARITIYLKSNEEVTRP